MNKLHAVFLTTVLCSMVYDLTASQEQKKVPFMSEQTKDRCKTITQRIIPFYAGASSIGVLRNAYKYYVNPPLNLIQRSYFGNEQNLSPSKFVNFNRANLRLVGGLGATAPFVCVALLAYDDYHQNLKKTWD
jgi:hypothetical protein